MMPVTISPAVARAAAEAGRSAPRFTGYVTCARAYVQIVGGIDKPSRGVLKAAGLNVTMRPNNRAAIYVGYDNATGREYGKAIAIAAALKAHGIDAYEDADED